MYSPVNAPVETYQKFNLIIETSKNGFNYYLESGKWFDGVVVEMKKYSPAISEPVVKNLFSYASESKYLYYLSKSYMTSPKRWVSRDEILSTIGGRSGGNIYRHVVDYPPSRGFLKIIEKKGSDLWGGRPFYKLKEGSFSSKFSDLYVRAVDRFPTTLTPVKLQNVNHKNSFEYDKIISAGVNPEKLEEVLMRLRGRKISRINLEAKTEPEIIKFLWDKRVITLAGENFVVRPSNYTKLLKELKTHQ